MGNRLRELRNEKRISQSQLAKIIHVGKSTISRYENAERGITSETLTELAKYFNVTTDYFLGISSVRNEYPNDFIDVPLNTSIVINAVKNIEFQKFTTKELNEFIELMKENAKYILYRRAETPFSSRLKVAETERKNKKYD